MIKLVITATAMTTALWSVGCGQTQSEAAPAAVPMEDRAVAVTAVALEAATVADRTTLPADIFPLRRTVLAAEVPGTVESLDVREGQQVRKGRRLMAIDTRSLKQRLNEAEAVDRQRRLQFERAQALLERRSITQMQFLDAQTARDVAAAQLASAQLELEKSSLTAPWSGTVAVLRPEVGDYLSPGQPLIELVDTSTVEIRAIAPSSDVPF